MNLHRKISKIFKFFATFGTLLLVLICIIDKSVCSFNLNGTTNSSSSAGSNTGTSSKDQSFLSLLIFSQNSNNYIKYNLQNNNNNYFLLNSLLGNTAGNNGLNNSTSAAGFNASDTSADNYLDLIDKLNLTFYNEEILGIRDGKKKKKKIIIKRNSKKKKKREVEEMSSELKALTKNVSGILDSFKMNYDKRVRPNYGGDPVEVGVTMYVQSISSISEVLMDFTVDFYFRQKWRDPRLMFHGPKDVKSLSVGSQFLKSMWVPDTFFVNEKTSYFHHATTTNEFLRISQEGDVLRSIRLTVTATCPMDLRYFPMDSQLCYLEIESFGYTMSDIRYKWAAGATSVGVSNEVSLPQFKVLGYRQKAFEISLSTGNYSRLACEIQFVRSMGYYLIQIYIPSSLIVVISWVSFWLNRNAAPARVYLGITTVLTMTTLMSSTNKALPKISYVKSIDVFLGTCFVMVFAALLEYATVGYLAKRIQMRKNHFAALQKMAAKIQESQKVEQELSSGTHDHDHEGEQYNEDDHDEQMMNRKKSDSYSHEMSQIQQGAGQSGFMSDQGKRSSSTGVTIMSGDEYGGYEGYTHAPLGAIQPDGGQQNGQNGDQNSNEEDSQASSATHPKPKYIPPSLRQQYQVYFNKKEAEEQQKMQEMQQQQQQQQQGSSLGSGVSINKPQQQQQQKEPLYAQPFHRDKSGQRIRPGQQQQQQPLNQDSGEVFYVQPGNPRPIGQGPSQYASSNYGTRSTTTSGPMIYGQMGHYTDQQKQQQQQPLIFFPPNLEQQAHCSTYPMRSHQGQMALGTIGSPTGNEGQKEVIFYEDNLVLIEDQSGIGGEDKDAGIPPPPDYYNQQPQLPPIPQMGSNPFFIPQIYPSATYDDVANRGYISGDNIGGAGSTGGNSGSGGRTMRRQRERGQGGGARRRTNSLKHFNKSGQDQDLMMFQQSGDWLPMEPTGLMMGPGTFPPRPSQQQQYVQQQQQQQQLPDNNNYYYYSSTTASGGGRRKSSGHSSSGLDQPGQSTSANQQQIVGPEEDLYFNMGEPGAGEESTGGYYYSESDVNTTPSSRNFGNAGSRNRRINRYRRKSGGLRGENIDGHPLDDVERDGTSENYYYYCNYNQADGTVRGIRSGNEGYFYDPQTQQQQLGPGGFYPQQEQPQGQDPQGLNPCHCNVMMKDQAPGGNPAMIYSIDQQHQHHHHIHHADGSVLRRDSGKRPPQMGNYNRNSGGDIHDLQELGDGDHEMRSRRRLLKSNNIQAGPHGHGPHGPGPSTNSMIAASLTRNRFITQNREQMMDQTQKKSKQLQIPVNPNQICGITPSDIDKYSRVVFPVCFICFNLLYWIIYLHISRIIPTSDMILLKPPGS